MIGYEKQMKASLQIALGILEGGSKSVLAFGIVGNGKTFFPKALCQRLLREESKDFTVATIKCNKIPVEVSDPTGLRNDLNDAIDVALQHQPVITCFDEVDRICPHINRVPPGLGSLSSWLQEFLESKKMKDAKTLVIGTTNHPQCIELSVKRRFDIALYFEPTSPDVAKLLVKKHLVDREDVAKGYLKNFEKHHLQPMGAQIAQTCSEVKKNHTDLNTIPAEEIVRMLKANTPHPLSNKDVEEYKKENEDMINWSEEYIIPNYLDIYERSKKAKQ
jgi:SpoVK/Ycf46/Vps4 family AAA+-type ATPase